MTGRQLKPETEVRSLRREVKELRLANLRMEKETDAYRTRAAVADASVSEWKERFDQLLKCMSKSSSKVK